MISEISLDFGINVVHNKKRICLDPTKKVSCDYIFVSHAHTDHLHRQNNNQNGVKVVTSSITSRIAKLRGYEIGDSHEDHGFNLIDAGHILGSKGLLIEDELFYTGDISIRKRGFMEPAIIPKAKKLIIESTFGYPTYSFPKMENIIHETNLIISNMYNKGVPIVLMGHQLGKAQILSYLFRHWEPIFIHDAVYKVNQIYSEFGVDLSSYTSFSEAEDKKLLSANKPWILIAPLSSSKNSFLQYLKKKYGVVTIGFSGWAVKPNYRFLMGLDYCFPLSDHCDYHDLIKVVKLCDPENVFTFHGFSEEFANSLKTIGFDAVALNIKKVNFVNRN